MTLDANSRSKNFGDFANDGSAVMRAPQKDQSMMVEKMVESF